MQKIQAFCDSRSDVRIGYSLGELTEAPCGRICGLFMRWLDCKLDVLAQLARINVGWLTEAGIIYRHASRNRNLLRWSSGMRRYIVSRALAQCSYFGYKQRRIMRWFQISKINRAESDRAVRHYLVLETNDCIQ